MTMDRPTCATCAAFCEDGFKDGAGQCRRRAPRRQDGGFFPQVFRDLWCLEHVPQAAKDDHAEHLKEYTELVQRQRDKIDDAIRAEVNLRRAAELAPFTPPSGTVLQCTCPACAAERVKANDATLHQRIAEHLRWPQAVRTDDAPEPDPQGL